MKVKVKEVVKYGGHSLSANGSVNFTLKAQYSELSNTIQLMQMLNNDVSIKAKIPGGSPCLLYTSPSPRDRKPSRMPSSA